MRLITCEVCGAAYERVRNDRWNRCKKCRPAHRPPEPRHEGEYVRNRAIVLAAGDPCFWCGASATTVDHLVPVAEGGTHAVGNLVPACTHCNSSRGGRQTRRTVRSDRVLA